MKDRTFAEKYAAWRNEHTPRVHVYKEGLLCASVCAPAEMTGEEVAAEMLPSGTSHGKWCVSDEKTFAGGEPMPCPCEQDPSRRHWLLDC